MIRPWSGPRFCWFWPTFPNFSREKVDFSFSSSLFLPQNLAFFPYFPIQTAGSHIILQVFDVFCHQVGRIKVAGAFDKCIRCRILRSFICDGSRGLLLSTNSDFFKKLSILGTCWESKMGKKVKCLMKWVRIAPNLKILIPIDAPQVWDLKNAGFGKFSPILGVQQIWPKLVFFLFG